MLEEADIVGEARAAFEALRAEVLQLERPWLKQVRVNSTRVRPRTCPRLG